MTVLLFGLRQSLLIATLTFSIWVLGVGVLGVGVATAQIERPELAPAPFQAPAEGARFVFEDLASGKTQSGRFGATEGMLTSFTWDGREAASLTSFCADCALGLPNDGGPLAGLFPLRVGHGIRFTRRHRGRTWQDDILVTATERLTVPAGTFDTFIVRRRSELQDGDWWAEQRNWYAPSLGWVVKLEGKASDGRVEAWQLLEWRQ